MYPRGTRQSGADSEKRGTAPSTPWSESCSVRGSMRWISVVGTLLIAIAVPAESRWTGAYVRALPDDAFAAAEMRPGGRLVRLLPHHDAAGCVDRPHLRSALARVGQVKWLDPAEAERAREHLDQHLRELRMTPGPPSSGCRGRHAAPEG